MHLCFYTRKKKLDGSKMDNQNDLGFLNKMTVVWLKRALVHLQDKLKKSIFVEIFFGHKVSPDQKSDSFRFLVRSSLVR